MSKLKATLLAFAAASLTPVKHDCPNIKDEIYVKKMSLGEREAYFKLIAPLKENVNATAFVEVVCDKDGNKVFTDDDIADINKLPGDFVLAVLDTFAEANGFAKNANAAVADAEKNSEVA